MRRNPVQPSRRTDEQCTKRVEHELSSRKRADDAHASNLQFDGVLGVGTARFERNGDEFEAAGNALCGGWLPDSVYQPDDRPSFELCLNDCSEHPEDKHIVEICIPVKPL